MESKIRNIQEINKEIAHAKNFINDNEGRLASQMNRYSTPQKQRAIGTPNTSTSPNLTPQTSSKNPNLQSKHQNEQQISIYIKSLKSLCTSLQQKNYALEVDYRKALLNYQFKLDEYKTETAQLKHKIAQLITQNDQAKTKLKQLQNIIKQQQRTVKSLNEELSNFKTENVKIKLQNKTYKADNKVIMNHLDRLNQKKNNTTSLQQRQLRVMKSLYQSQNLNYQQNQAMKRYADTSQLSNRVMVEQAIDKNAELKRLVGKLGQEIQVLKREKQCLIQQCNLKAENLQSQKLIAKMNEESNEKLNGLIKKMGQKIINLEYLNQTLKNQLAKEQEGDENSNENYYRTTKSKAGQFYYKK